jgi:hypothetical protein
MEPTAAIHPGEHLAEELEVLTYKRCRTGAKNRRTDQSRHANPERHP